MNYINVESKKLHSFMVDVFKACGVRKGYSQIAADVLYYAEMNGFDSHGINNLERIYVSRLLDGRIDPQGEPEVVSDFGATAVIDGNNALGLVVGDEAIELAITKAEKYGVGVVAVRRSSHFGCAGYYTSRALEKGMIGIAMTNLGSQTIARPLNGIVNMLGTNPISISAPTGCLPPFLLDMSTTVVSTGKIRAAEKNGHSIPKGWLVDDEGEDITDPGAYDRGEGHIQMLGGKLETGGNKGYGLALLVDILCGVLSGANVGPDPALLKEGNEGRANNDQNIGHFFLAINVQAFRNLDSFRQQMDSMLGTLLKCPTKSIDKKVIYPGYNEKQYIKQRFNNNIPVHEEIYATLCNLAQRLDVNIPE